MVKKSTTNYPDMKRLFFAVALLSITACHKKPVPPANGTALPIEVTTPIVKEITLTREYPGYLKADATIPIMGRVNGTIIKRNFTEGSRVKKGDLLYVIEPTLYDNAVAQAEASLQTAIAQQEYARSNYERMQAAICYFTPPSHTSQHNAVHELMDEVDYYPDEYLNRLMHDGVNGLWLGASFRDLLPSTVIPEFGENSSRMIKKLNSVVEKCRRYGIGIYVFSIEPASGFRNPYFEQHPELFADEPVGNVHHFCPAIPACETYLREAVHKLFTLVPNLKGILDITCGEAEAGCSAIPKLVCRRCQKKFGTLGKTLAFTEKVIADAMHEIKPDAEFISWTYSQRDWDKRDLIEACQERDPKVIHMQNFEDFGRTMQLGKERLAIDYWLSYVGPGEAMEYALRENTKRGVRTYAKIQACSSHELSTVPYVLSPGNLYDKYKYMHENGISGVVQCWLFGNYPCVMNKAACELSFEPFMENKEDFLKHLAGVYFGEESEKASRAYALFEKGYKNFPTSCSFEWFGPMQDSPAAPLHLLPVDLHMPQTYLCKSMLGGDRIGVCTREGHTLDEAIELSTRMAKYWDEGMEFLSDIDSMGKEERYEQQNVARATSILFNSGLNILKFYRLRHLIGIQKGELKTILKEMRDIVYSEIENSANLKKLCLIDGRLGYHSEALGYKFFPEKLDWRIAELYELLENEFPLVESRIEKGEIPLPFYYALEEGQVAYNLTAERIEDAVEMKFHDEPEYTSLYASEKDGEVTLRIKLADGKDDRIVIQPEFNLFMPLADITLKGGELILKEKTSISFYGERIEQRRRDLNLSYDETETGCVYTLKFNRKNFRMEDGEPFRFGIRRYGKHNDTIIPRDRVFTFLIDGTYSPDEYIFFIKK